MICPSEIRWNFKRLVEHASVGCVKLKVWRNLDGCWYFHATLGGIREGGKAATHDSARRAAVDLAQKLQERNQDEH